MSGYAAINAGRILGSTRRAALTGTFSRSVPVGVSRKALTTSLAFSSSSKAGAMRANNALPASVSTTLRVVRLNSRTPSDASMRLIASL